jgi:hypothetical protein
MGLRKECGYVGLEQSVRQAAGTRFFELGYGNAAKEEGLCLTRAIDKGICCAESNSLAIFLLGSSL